jgi:hypothetical protein
MKDRGDPTRILVPDREHIGLEEDFVALKTQESYEYYLNNDRKILTKCRYIEEKAKSDTPEDAPYKQIKSMLSKLPSLPKLRHLSPNDIAEGGWEDEIDKNTEILKKVGIELSSDDFYLQGDGQESFYNIIVEAQSEYSGVDYATRIFLVAQEMLKRYAPELPVLKRNSLYVRKFDVSGYNAHSRTDINGNNLLMLSDNNANTGQFFDIEEVGLESSVSLDVQVISAAHELGHAEFDEMVNDWDKSKGQKTHLNAAYFRRALTEGYAIMWERVAEEIFESLNGEVDGDPNNINSGAGHYKNRNEYLNKVKDNDSVAGTYTLGHKVMRNLVLVLGLEKENRVQQILGVTEYLKKVDIARLGEIKLDPEMAREFPERLLAAIPMKEN